MPGMEESLFSLELVVEKLYIPHVTCRFPAVAFRLLDFPTIVINHVEGDLGKAIRRQISFDPDYEMPEQFCELKDKHGNFMIKKGKSCLFKMVAETLKNHLSNTPLYVMLIDMFPEVPKLAGNSTVPLNVLIDAICSDLVRMGSTVPSVHGDKGLFKIYNLMGKEIGYFVLGFRLLCLGPSLIPHLPEAALVQRQSKKQKARQLKENRQLVNMVQLSQEDGKKQEEDSEEDLIETRTWGSMTEPIKQDVMMQTVEMDHKGVHVDIQNPTIAPPVTAVAVATTGHLPTVQQQIERATHHSGTQTDKKGIKAAFNAKQKVLEDLASMEEDKDEDEVIITNIVCPPPLFFNCDAKPRVEVDDDSYSLDTDMSLSDDVSVESFTDEELEEFEMGRTVTKSKPRRDKESVIFDRGQIVPPPAPVSYSNVPLNVHFADPPSQQRSQRRSASSPNQQALGGFPLLGALMNELLRIQNPNMFQGLGVETQLPSAGQPPTPSPSAGSMKSVGKSASQQRLEEINANSVATEKENADEKDIFGCSRKGHRKCAHPHPGVPKDKSWLRVIPEYGKKKSSKLMFGLTNTQRLRLQKTNPGWLRDMDRMEAASKNDKGDHAANKHDSGDEVNISHHDTLTEVRRQAQRELEKPAANQSLADTSYYNTASAASPKRGKARAHSAKRSSPSSGIRTRQMKQAYDPKLRSPKSPSRSKGRRVSHDSNEPTSSRPHSVDPSVKHIMSPDPGGIVPRLETGDMDDVPVSARSVDQISSARSRSIEVRMPSVQTTNDNDSEATITDSEGDEDLPLPDESFSQNGRQKRPVNFPSYLKHSESLPESIEGRPNQSLNTTTGYDENSPLESTRNYNPELGTSRTMQSTDDLDTKQTFHSTSEAELQGLVSEDEQDRHGNNGARLPVPSMKFPVVNPMMSQNSPVPSTRRSVAKLDLSRSQLPVTPRGDTATPRSSRSASPKRPTPRPRRPLREFKESFHTDSISSYMPSDPDNVPGGSFSSGDGAYSDDFQEDSVSAMVNLQDRPRLIPSAKLGYTIN